MAIKGENTLVASMPGQGEMELLPYKGTEFTLKGMAGAGIEFVKDESGEVIEAILKQPGASLNAKKKVPGTFLSTFRSHSARVLVH